MSAFSLWTLAATILNAHGATATIATKGNFHMNKIKSVTVVMVR